MLRCRLTVPLLLTLAAASARADGYANDPPRAQPQMLQGGVQQEQTPDFEAAAAQLAQDQQWEAQARSLQQQQQQVLAGSFMGNPVISRVTSVGEILKQDGVQKITALPIRTVTISDDGSVDLGQIVDGSGGVFYIPPGSLQKGDLFTQVGNQYVKVPADHFDAMGSLADQVNKQSPPDSPSALNQLANQLANAADGYRNNAANFATDFLLGAGNALGTFVQTLAQPRGDFGRPGKPMQDILDYLNNDNQANQVQLNAMAQQALQTVATRPGALLGNALISSRPAGALGR